MIQNFIKNIPNDLYLTIILVPFLTFLSNFLFFFIKSKRERSKSLLKDRLTKLLFPIYFILKNDEAQMTRYQLDENLDMYEYYSDMPERLFIPIIEIINKNLYLADDILHGSCMDFINWYFSSSSYQRFQDLHNGNFKESEYFIFFKKNIYKEYIKSKKKYLS